MAIETPLGAETYYLNMDHYINDYAGHALNSLRAMSEWLPSSPVDVGERIYVAVGSREYYETSEQPLEEFIAELRDVSKKVPKRYEAVFTLRASYCFDDPANPEWEIGYWRDPTKKERAEREETNCKIAERDARRKVEAAEKERAEFERLKAKFDSPDRIPKGGNP